MSRLDLSACERLLSREADQLLAAIDAMTDPESPSPSDVERLRRVGPAELVPSAIELVAARRRAAAKIDNAARLLCDREGVEQASGSRVARHKAQRFAAAGITEVVDVCCGIGGDAIEMVLAGIRVVGVDRDPARARMAKHNAGCESQVATAEELDLPGQQVAIHVDPARRLERTGGHPGRRLWRLDDLRPSVAVVERLLDRRTGAWKLGPGTDLSTVPRAEEREIEIVAGRDELLQCVVWTGELARAPGRRTATRLSDGTSFTSAPSSPAAIASGFGRYLLVPHAGLERAGLVTARLGARPFADLAPGLGVLTGDSPIEDPWFECHAIHATMPWRETRIVEWLRAHDAGRVIVRTRGGAVDVDGAARAFRGQGQRHYTVFGLRLGRRVVAVISD